MGTPKFPVPADLLSTISLLNRQKMKWNLSVISKDDSLYILDGDQVQFVTNDIQEAKAFLYGIFLATYEGKSLHSIEDQS